MLKQRRAASAVDRLRAQLAEGAVVMPHTMSSKRQRSPTQNKRPHSAPATRTTAATVVAPHDVSVSQAATAIKTADEVVLTQKLPVNVMVNGPGALFRELKVDSISRAEFFNIFYNCTDNRLTLADLVCMWRIHSIHVDGAAERSMGPDGFAFACTAAAKAKHAHGAYKSATPAALTRLLLREAYTFYSPSAATAGRSRKGRGSHELLWGGGKALFGTLRYVLRLDIADFLTEQHAFASALFASGLTDSDGEGPMSWAKVAATNARLPYTGFVALLAGLLQAPEALLLQAPLASPQALAAAFSAVRTAPHRARQAAALQAAAGTNGRAAAAAAAVRDAAVTGSAAKYSTASDEYFDREPGLLYPQFVEALMLLADAAAEGLRQAYPDIAGASSASKAAAAAASAGHTGLRGGLKLAASRRRRSQLQQQLQAAALSSTAAVKPVSGLAAVVSAASAGAEAVHELRVLQALFHHMRSAVAARAAAAAAPAALVCAVPETDSDCDDADGLLGLAWARSPSPHRHRASPSPTRTAVKHSSSSSSSSAVRPQSAPDHSRARHTAHQQQQQQQQPLTFEESAARAAAVESQLLAALDRVEALATAAAPQRIGPLSLLQPPAATAAAAAHLAQRRHTTTGSSSSSSSSAQPAIALVMLDVPVVPPHAPEPVQRLLETALTHQAAGHCSAAAAAVAAAAALWRGLVTRLSTAERVALLLAEASVAQAAASGCTAALRAAAEAIAECLNAGEAAQRSALLKRQRSSTSSTGSSGTTGAVNTADTTVLVSQSMAQALGLSDELLSALAAGLSVAGAAWYYSERTALALRAYALAAHLLLPLLPPPRPPAAPPAGRGKAAAAAAAAATAATAVPTAPLEEPRYVSTVLRL
jgi:hypothetical protein